MSPPVNGDDGARGSVSELWSAGRDDDCAFARSASPGALLIRRARGCAVVVEANADGRRSDVDSGRESECACSSRIRSASDGTGLACPQSKLGDGHKELSS